jgi:hypothetical protein
MGECVNSIVWQAITKGEPTSRTFKKLLQEKIEMKGLKFQQLQGSAAIKRGPGASGAHLYNYTLPPIVHYTPPQILSAIKQELPCSLYYQPGCKFYSSGDFARIRVQ